ncbi:hypothetical protein HOM50_03185 [bacterium]|nr:hypothetical protein [bacterium]MBT5015380.1 hypothetical protein [bacterium]
MAQKKITGVVVLSLLMLFSSKTTWSMDLDSLEKGLADIPESSSNKKEKALAVTGTIFDYSQELIGPMSLTALGMLSHATQGRDATTTAISFDLAGESFAENRLALQGNILLLQGAKNVLPRNVVDSQAFNLVESVGSNKKGRLLQAVGWGALATAGTGFENIVLGYQTGAPLAALFAAGQCIRLAFCEEDLNLSPVGKPVRNFGTQYDEEDSTRGEQRWCSCLGYKPPVTKTVNRASFTKRLLEDREEMNEAKRLQQLRQTYIPKCLQGHEIAFDEQGQPVATSEDTFDKHGKPTKTLGLTIGRRFVATGSDKPHGVGAQFNPLNTTMQTNITHLLAAAKPVANKGVVEGCRVLEPSANILAKLKSRYTGDGEGSDEGSAHSDDQLTGRRSWQNNALAGNDDQL